MATTSDAPGFCGLFAFWLAYLHARAAAAGLSIRAQSAATVNRATVNRALLGCPLRKLLDLLERLAAAAPPHVPRAHLECRNAASTTSSSFLDRM